jgi:hypothetical protein
LNFNVPYVNPNIGGQRVGENHIELLSGNWPGDDESMLPIVTSIVNTTINSIVNVAIASLAHLCETIRQI